jgi:hypothetical protein
MALIGHTFAQLGGKINVRDLGGAVARSQIGRAKYGGPTLVPPTELVPQTDFVPQPEVFERAAAFGSAS